MEQLWHKGMHFATCYAQCHLALLQIWITIDVGVKDSLSNLFFQIKKKSLQWCHVSFLYWLKTTWIPCGYNIPALHSKDELECPLRSTHKCLARNREGMVDFSHDGLMRRFVFWNSLIASIHLSKHMIQGPESDVGNFTCYFAGSHSQSRTTSCLLCNPTCLSFV